jgi:hypothetical protein
MGEELEFRRANIMYTPPEELPTFTQTSLVFAARYAHTRPTGAAYQVVNSILYHWDELEASTKEQLVREAKNEATYNMEDWNRLIKMGDV